MMRAREAVSKKLGKRVLMSAYACEPDKGSEPGVGWNQVRQMARFHEIWLITRSNNRNRIEKAVSTSPLANVHWIYFDLPPWARIWKKGKRGVHLYYLLWQAGVYVLGKRLHRRVRFDLVHHVSFVNYWMPSLLSLLPVPFVWGPVGGGESYPGSFVRFFGLRGRLHESLRNAARRLGECNPLVRLTARRTSIALAATPETGVRLELLGCRRIELFSQIGMTREEIRDMTPAAPRGDGLFRLLSVGELLHLKGFDFGLRAFCRLQKVHPDSEYCLIGEGPERNNLEKLSRLLGISGKVRFEGALRRDQVLKRLPCFDVLLHPSFHDSGSLVCLEAMTAAVPVICLDLGGPGLNVTEETGVKIPAISGEQVVEDMTEALKYLASNSGIARRKGQAGRRRVEEHFCWEAKGERMAKIYESLVE
jgi:glycosyltransferase involved in cell wall biosynthesis